MAWCTVTLMETTRTPRTFNPPADAPQEGDEVMVTFGRMEGMVATVVMVAPSGRFFTVRTEDGECTTVHESDVEVAS